jgi:hypothetical protein
MFSLSEETQKKWAPILEHEDLAPIKDSHRRSVTAQILENTERALREDANHGSSSSLLSEQPISTNNWGNSSANGGTGGNINAFDPILISLVRRSMPNLMAYDIAGVQPMSGPTGLIFAMRSRYTNQTGAETFYNEVNTAFSSVTTGANTFGQKNVGTLPTGVVNTYNTGTAMGTAQLEALGTDANAAFAEMAFSIEKVTVTAGGRALKAEYSMELAQDLKAVHGLDAETELSNILSTEILAEINREVVRTVNIIAKPGAQVDTATAGVFDLDTDSNGRWSVEKFKGLMFQLEREANQIAKDTRRGKGNIVICSADVASALQMAGVLDYTPALDRNNNMTIDDTGNTFAGVLNGRLKVYIDPYAIGGNYLTVGFKGTNPFDAGLFYCPYVPLQMVRAIDPQSFQPKIGFKTRYGMVANPYAEGLTKGLGALNANANVYYRRIAVANLM